MIYFIILNKYIYLFRFLKKKGPRIFFYLADISINLQVIPILNENEKFDYLKFYAVRLF